MSNSYDTTDLTIAGVGPAGHTSNVDVWYTWDGASGGNIYPELVGRFARSRCESIAVSSTGSPLVHFCNHWHVIIDDESSGFNTRPTEWYRGLACHETGHTVGLKHADWRTDPPAEVGPNAGRYDMYRCLDRPADQWLGSHNAAHLNGFY
jgi:hypothetical protein